MSNEVATLDQGPPALPADLAAQFEESSNLPERVTVPSLSYSGKVWSINMNGEQTRIEGKNADGDLVPLPVMRVIVLDWAKSRGRAFYAGAYDPAKTAMPDCWSDDGEKPSQYVREPINSVCKTCPNAGKGSKITDAGKETTACSQHRMIAVVPAARPFDFPPLRLKLAVTSDFDSKSPDQEAKGWFAFRPFTDQLKARGVKHTAQLIVKMKFDPSVAFPKVLFALDKWTPTDVLSKLMPTILGDEVKSLISGNTWTPNGTDGEPVKALPPPDEGTVEEQIAPVAPKPVAAKPVAKVTPVVAKPKAAPKPPAEDGEDVVEEWLAPGSPEPEAEEPAAPAKPVAVAAKPVARAAQPAPKAQVVTPAAKPKTPAAPVSETPDDPELAGLLNDWDN